MKRGLKLVYVPQGGTYEDVRTQAPMKRGLKLQKHHCYITNSPRVRTQAPMKRGLKHVDHETPIVCAIVRTQAPMKRGLKLLEHVTPPRQKFVVRTQAPMKRGLKQGFLQK